ncbi:MAG: hypothetical protein IT369_11455 [Candidatus Latescibacteria bacterium]|nr:hypothetical protein [Candidatus Latescibacterota bacterium]
MKGRVSLSGLFLAIGLGCIAVSPSIAQEEAQSGIARSPDSVETLSPEVGVFEFQGLSVNEFIYLLKMVGINYQSVSTIGNKTYLRFESKEDLGRARQVWQQTDTPLKNISLKIQLVSAAASYSREKGAKLGYTQDEELLGYLSKLFKYSYYEFLSSSYMVAKSGRSVELNLEGVAAGEKEGKPAKEIFSVDVKPIFIDEGNGVIRLENLEIDREYPASADLLETTLNVRNGETVVVGGSNLDGRIYIVVITAQTIE